MSQNFPHSCQDDHELIGWSGDDELCPVCQLRVERETLIAGLNAALRYSHDPFKVDDVEYAEEIQSEIEADRAAVRAALAAAGKEKGE